ncbi:MAG: cobalt-zinc-cadmium efflux system protein, partial [bacterium]
MGHSHQHSGHDHGDLKGTRLGVSILLNLLITIGQAIGGMISGSLSLLSDALHNFSDVIALILSYVADKLTKKKFTTKETYGYKRAEIIAAMINAVTLISIAVIIIRESFERFNQPQQVNSMLVIIFAGLSILVNAGSAFLLKKDAENNMNMRSAYLHLFSDMITSVAVLIGGLCMYFWKIYWVDSVLSFAIAIYLIYSSWGLLMQTLRVLMQFVPENIDLNIVAKEVQKISEVSNLHHVHVWQINDNEIHLEAHVDFEDDLSLSKANLILKQIRGILHDHFGI